MTKNRSTPRKPPGSTVGAKWNTTTAATAKARRPSSPASDWLGRPLAMLLTPQLPKSGHTDHTILTADAPTARAARREGGRLLGDRVLIGWADLGDLAGGVGTLV